MMKSVLFFFVLLFIVPATSFATSSAPAPKLKVENEQTGPISNKLANDVYEQCLFHIPPRFTPQAREYYCACNSAALQGNFMMEDYKELQKPGNLKPGNKTFEKYVSKAVAPCVDMPVEQIEYLDCVLDSSLDVRVGYVPGYCSCVAKKIRNHAKANADVEIMTRLAEFQQGFKDPVEALWDNNIYINTKLRARDDCLANPNQ